VPPVPEQRVATLSMGSMTLSMAGPYGFIKAHEHPKTSMILSRIQAHPRAADGTYKFRADLVPSALLQDTLSDLNRYHVGMRIPPTADQPGLDLDHEHVERLLSFDKPASLSDMGDAINTIRAHFGTLSNLPQTPNAALNAHAVAQAQQVVDHVSEVAPSEVCEISRSRAR
jgi:hypothetical protein